MSPTLAGLDPPAAATQATALWCVPVTLFGAIVGSFLNVVIHRLPRGMSVSSPRWSRCPHCRSTLRAIDNIPILSWLALRGRCRTCQAPIAFFYPLVEISTALLCLAVWDGLFVSQALRPHAQPAHDWPIAIAYVTLLATLLAGSIMDIEAYTIDIRLPILAVSAGIVLHGLAACLHDSTAWPVPSNRAAGLPFSLVVIGACMFLAWSLTQFLVRPGNTDATPAPEADSCDAGRSPELLPAPAVHPPSTFQPWPILLLVLILGGLVYWCAATPRTTLGPGTLNPGAQRAILVASVFLVMLLVASMQHRQADEQIIGEIEETRGQSRKMVLRELLAFTPSLLVAVGLFILLRSTGRLEEGPAFWLGSLPAPLRAALAASIQAAGGAVFAATIGWTVRILGTLAFRKEAFGTGDIYLIAAIGAVGTAWTALFAFLIGSVLALVGVLVIAFRKSSRAIPFGPWLALGAYVALWVEPRLTAFFQPLGDWLWSLLAGAQTPY